MEKRKTMEAILIRKLAVYRCRSAFLDKIDAAIEIAVKKI